MMKCPKCAGNLKVYKTIVDDEYMDVDMVCDKDDEHGFWCRLHSDDFEEA